ncbi:MAG: hypothetical protein Q7R93_00985 [bacterium]|nr:hypothetical protein [bacterium]
MLDEPEEITEIAEITQNHGLDMEDAEKVKEIIDDESLDEDEAVELADEL